MTEQPQDPTGALAIGFSVQPGPARDHHVVMHLQSPTINIAVDLGPHTTAVKAADHFYNGLMEGARTAQRQDSGIILANEIPKANGS